MFLLLRLTSLDVPCSFTSAMTSRLNSTRRFKCWILFLWTCCHSFYNILTRFTSLSFFITRLSFSDRLSLIVKLPESLSFVLVQCHSFLFVVTRCTTRFYLNKRVVKKEILPWPFFLLRWILIIEIVTTVKMEQATAPPTAIHSRYFLVNGFSESRNYTEKWNLSYD